MRTLITFLLLAAHLQNYGQPVLDQEVYPSTGSVFGYHDVPYLIPGPAGSGLRWDYSALPQGTLVPYTWSTTDIAPGAGAFPSNSLVRQVPGEPTAYLLRTDSALLWMGTYSDTALLRFDPPLRELVPPCNMGDQWSDTSVVAVTGAGRISILDVRYNVKADAWGTLIMPYGTVPNVMRVRSELVLLDRRYKQWPLRTETRYSWYSEETSMPLLVIIERKGWAPPDRLLRWLDGTWREDPSVLFKPIALRPFPDPCVDNITLDLSATQIGRTVIQLIDGSGNVALQWHEEFNSPQTRRIILDVSSVPSGQYTLAWIGTNGTLGNARLTKR